MFRLKLLIEKLHNKYGSNYMVANFDCVLLVL